MADAAPRSLPRFVLLTLAWLPVAFAVWYFTAPALLWPAQLLAELFLGACFPELFRGFEADGATFRALTSLKPGQTVAGGTVSVDVNMLLYAYGLPMFAALVLAAHGICHGRSAGRVPRALAQTRVRLPASGLGRCRR